MRAGGSKGGVGGEAMARQEDQDSVRSGAISTGVERLGQIAVDAGLKVHRTLGPGLLESVYEHCLEYELKSRGLAVRRQVALPVAYESVLLDAGYRLDLVVENSVVLEVKSVEALTRLHEAQLLTYLKLSRLRLGFLMNFNVVMFKEGLRRLVR
jgi:GxxExxY protein